MTRSDARRTRSGIVALASSFLLLIGVIAATATLVAMQERAARQAIETVQSHDDAGELLFLMQDAETGQRGYLLTRGDAYLRPYDAALAKIDETLRRLSSSDAGTSARDQRIADLRAATGDKLVELRQTIDLARAGQVDSAMAIVRSDRGRLLMERIRALVAGFRTESSNDMRARQAIFGWVGQLLEVAVAVAILLSLGLGAFVIRAAWRRNTTLVDALDRLGAANTELAAAADRRETLEQQLRQAQKMEALGQLTGGLAHDFNNMLSIIIGNLNLIRRKTERRDPNIDLNVAHALDGAERASNLTHRLLAFARRQPLSPQTIGLNAIVPGLSELLRRTLGETVRIETILAGGLWACHVDPNQLESTLVNLALNARDAMQGSGTLTIETANTHLDDGYANENVGVTPGQFVMLAVSDTGAGMASDVMVRAFDPFFTTKAVGQGTGLGLSQVYGFVKQSNGHVKIYSEAGRGTTVKIYLPRLMVTGLSTPRPATPPEAMPNGTPRELILVVEDEDTVRRTTVETLRDLQYSVIHANGAARALSLLESYPDITLLFTDIVMPEIDGKQLADRALKQRPDLKVLFTTGYTRNAIVQNGVLDPGVHLIGKPFTIAQLASKVRQVISEKAA